MPASLPSTRQTGPPVCDVGTHGQARSECSAGATIMITQVQVDLENSHRRHSSSLEWRLSNRQLQLELQLQDQTGESWLVAGQPLTTVFPGQGLLQARRIRDLNS